MCTFQAHSHAEGKHGAGEGLEGGETGHERDEGRAGGGQLAETPLIWHAGFLGARQQPRHLPHIRPPGQAVDICQRLLPRRQHLCRTPQQI